MPIAPRSFDVVVNRSMFHHAADLAATLGQMHRACVPGGRVMVSDLSPESSKSAAFDAIELLRDPSHMHALTKDELRDLGADLGLQEFGLRANATSLQLEAVLDTSFPAAGMKDHVRRLLARDARSGDDAFGLAPEMRGGALWVTYPMITVGWLAA